MRVAGVAWIVGAVLCATGCASGGGQSRGGAEGGELQGEKAFPAPGELAAIARQPAPSKVFAPRPPDVSVWELKQAPAQVPAQVEHQPQGFWDGLLAAQAARRGGAVRLTEPMACLARLVGQYLLERQTPPGESTLAFLAARCGVPDPGIGYAFVTRQPLRGGEPEEELQHQMGSTVEESLRKALANGTLTAGVWFGREKARAVAMVVHAQPRVRLDALPAVPGPDGHVVVRGELLRPADRIDALINRGRYGVRRCGIDPDVPLPRFAVDCETDPADEAEALEIAAFAPKRVMGPIVVRALVWPGGKLPTTYRKPPAAVARAGAAGRDLPAALVASLNDVRAAAGLAPVTVAASQSETAALLAPHFFAAEGRQQADQVDSIAVGVMAGWQVNGLVRAGHFTAASIAEASNEGGLLAAALDRPSGREALLDRDIRAVAVGTVREEGRMGALFGAYAFLDAASPAAEAASVVRRIDEARARRGLPPTFPLDRLSRDVAEIALAMERGERNPRGALRSILDKAVQATTGGRAYAWTGFGERLERIDLPEEVVSATAVQVAVGVAHCKPKGSPWVGYCVLVAAVQQTVTASAERAGGPLPIAVLEAPFAPGLSRGERVSARMDAERGEP